VYSWLDQWQRVWIRAREKFDILLGVPLYSLLCTFPCLADFTNTWEHFYHKLHLFHCFLCGSLLYTGYRVFPGSKAGRAWRCPPTSSNVEVNERVELYLYSPSGPSWAFSRVNFTFISLPSYVSVL
jgi:hypothetical protein